MLKGRYYEILGIVLFFVGLALGDKIIPIIVCLMLVGYGEYLIREETKTTNPQAGQNYTIANDGSKIYDEIKKS